MKQLILMSMILFGCILTLFSLGKVEEDTPLVMTRASDTSEGAGAMMADESISKTGVKITFTDLDAARSIAARGPAVLFFYAGWCPTCKIAMKDIDENGKKLKDITVLVVNYDTAHDLKKEYMVTYQHTFVQIDESGKKLAVWNGGGVDGILKNTIRKEGN